MLTKMKTVMHFFKFQLEWHKCWLVVKKGTVLYQLKCPRWKLVYSQRQNPTSHFSTKGKVKSNGHVHKLYGATQKTNRMHRLWMLRTHYLVQTSDSWLSSAHFTSLAHANNLVKGYLINCLKSWYGIFGADCRI